MRLRPLREQSGNLLPLLDRQPRRPTGMFPRRQTFHTFRTSGRKPLTHGPLGHAKSLRNLSLLPAPPLQFPAATTTNLTPILGLVLVHTLFDNTYPDPRL